MWKLFVKELAGVQGTLVTDLDTDDEGIVHREGNRICMELKKDLVAVKDGVEVFHFLYDEPIEPYWIDSYSETNPDEKSAYVFDCPGCNQSHLVPMPRWTFTGTREKPTFNPSLLCTTRFTDAGRPTAICHSFIRDGMIQFLGDCTHHLAGQTVPIWRSHDR